LYEIQEDALGKGYEPDRIHCAEEWFEYLSVKVSKTNKNGNKESETQ